MKAALFPLGRVVFTPGAVALIEARGQDPAELLERHRSGDWGAVPEEDARENELSVREGFRIVSCYEIEEEYKLWIITEADRSSTCLLLPEEY